MKIKQISNRIIKDNPLFLIFILPIVMDITGTVIGQPKEYWTQGYQNFNEAVPFIYLLLKIHPLLFLSFCLVIWLSFTYWLTKKLKEPLNIWATGALLVGHSYNSIAWLRVIFRNQGIFAGTDQFSQALSLIPMTIEILFIGWVASKGFLLYMEKRQSK